MTPRQAASRIFHLVLFPLMVVSAVVGVVVWVMVTATHHQHPTTTVAPSGEVKKVTQLSPRETSENIGAGDYIVRITMDNGKQLVCIENPSGDSVAVDCNWPQFNKDSGR